MCLIVFKENNESVYTNRQFKNMITRNPDGLGVMWREDGRVLTHKTLGSNKEKFRIFQAIRNVETFAMHARIKTHGLISLDNCHPYEILNIDKGDPIDLFMMHNGMIPNAPEVNKDMSDTWHYVEHVLKPLFKSNIDLVWENDTIQDMITKHIGYSKLLFMRSDDVESPVLIFNMKMGTDKHGCWLSNTHSEDTVYVAPRHTYNDNWSRGHYGYGNQHNRDVTPEVAKELDKEDYYETIYGAGAGIEKNDLTEDKKSVILALPSNKDKQILPDVLKEQALVRDFSDVATEAMYMGNPTKHLLELLYMLRSMSDTAIKDLMQNEPHTIADIVEACYANNTMDYNTILESIKDKSMVNDNIKLIRDMAVTDNAKKLIKA